MQVEQDAKNECMSWASQKCKGAMKDAALRDMSTHFLVVVFLPFHAAEIRQKIKYWGDTNGFMTQCIVSALLPSETCCITSLLDCHSVKKTQALRGTNSMTNILIISV